MEFLRGLCSAMFLYTIAWGIFQWGYSEGKDSVSKRGYTFNETRQAFIK